MTQITRAALLAVAAFTGTMVAAVADVPSGADDAAGRKDVLCCECGAAVEAAARGGADEADAPEVTTGAVAAAW